MSVGARHCLAPTAAKFGKPLRGSIPTVVGSYKSAVSYRINTIWNTKGQSIWQRNYYEHVGRDEASLDKIQQYIVENPWRWAEDAENPRYYPVN